MAHLMRHPTLGEQHKGLIAASFHDHGSSNLLHPEVLVQREVHAVSSRVGEYGDLESTMLNYEEDSLEEGEVGSSLAVADSGEHGAAPWPQDEAKVRTVRPAGVRQGTLQHHCSEKEGWVYLLA
ncbi:hypothetical protein NDU88_005483 [Pleurodeles waltl]|uniref:Uncharacterized protein n=1 Tax=Pleurodeles waltl TaxID=8319 RepID=A0AAV7UK55_PLEWA|nr:hypothetical protein NDU88_005483 [Pleurodeles waltl]